MPQIIPYANETEWLNLRDSDVTSSDVAVLFDQSPYQTIYEYWHRKKNGLVVEFETTERVKWGRRYEAPTAEGLAEDNGWKAIPLKTYMRHDTIPHMGSSFDYEIEENGEIGILEIKCVDFAEYKKKWLADGDTVEAPVHIELQLQHQLEVADRNFGYIAAMIGGNKPVVVRRDRDREMGALIGKKITEFWESIKNNHEPTPDFAKDGDIIKLLYADTSGEEVDLSSNNRFPELLRMYDLAHAAEVDGKKHKEAIKGEMITLMGNASIAKCNGSYVTRKTVKRAGYTVKDTEYIDMRIKQPKGDKQ